MVSFIGFVLPYITILVFVIGMIYVLTTSMIFPAMNSFFDPDIKLPTVTDPYLLGVILAPVFNWITGRSWEKIKGTEM